MSVVDLKRPGPATPPASTYAELGQDEATFRRFYAFVRHVVARLGVAQEAVEDAAQEVFMVFFQRADAFEQRGHTRGLLYGIARRVAKRHRDRAATRRRGTPLKVAPRDVDLEHDTDQRRMARVVRDVLTTMDEGKRLALVLIDVEGMTIAEAAEAQGQNPNTIYSRLRAARTEVRAAVEHHMQESP